MHLTREQVEAYDRDGILVFSELFSEAELAVLRGEVERLKAVEDECIFREGESNTPKIVFKMDDPGRATYSAPFRALSRIPRALAMARQVLRDDRTLHASLQAQYESRDRGHGVAVAPGLYVLADGRHPKAGHDDYDGDAGGYERDRRLPLFPARESRVGANRALSRRVDGLQAVGGAGRADQGDPRAIARPSADHR